jgi:hypothetical protein
MGQVQSRLDKEVHGWPAKFIPQKIDHPDWIAKILEIFMGKRRNLLGIKSILPRGRKQIVLIL